MLKAIEDLTRTEVLEDNTSSKNDMRTVKLIRLTLTNWRGQTKTISPNGDSVVISGTNHSGKSSVMNAFLWCVLGTDHLDRANYLLFDNTIEQTHDNAVPAEVEMELMIDDMNITLKRVATQGWVRRRGTDVYERSGSDNYSFFVDGIERSATQYKADIEEFFGASTEKLKIILNLNYFLSLKWDVQRKLLGDIIGEVSESDFSGDFGDIFEGLKRYSLEDLKQKYKSLLKPVKEDMEKLPVAIETLQSSLPSLDGYEAAKNRLGELQKDMESIEQQISNKAAAVKEFSDRRIAEIKEISRMEEELEFKKKQYIKSIRESAEVKSIEDKIVKVSSRNSRLNSEAAQDRLTMQSLIKQKESLSLQCIAYQKKDESLREEIRKIKASEFTADTCPYCGQQLPEDKLEEARAKFNEKKAFERQRVVSLGQSNKELWNDALAQIEGIDTKILSLENKTYNIEPTDKLEAEMAAIIAAQPKFEDTLEYKEKASEIEVKKASMTEIPESSDPELIAKKNAIQTEMSECYKAMGVVKLREEQLKVIEEKKNNLRDASIEAARLEGLLNKLAQYEREKAEIIRQRVNNLFKYCDVQMETLDKSGLPVPTCIINDKGGVDARVTNTASGYNCRIDISMAFSRFYGVNLPLFIDNAEAVNDNCLLDTPRQTIELKVSEAPFEMRLR